MKYITLSLIAGSIVLFSCHNSSTVNNKQEATMQEFKSDSLHLSFSYPKNWEIKTNTDHIGLFEYLEDSSDDFEENIIIWKEDMPVGISDSLYAQAAATEMKIKNPSIVITNMQQKKIGDNRLHSFEFDFKNNDSSNYHVIVYTMVCNKTGYNFSCTSSPNKFEKHKSTFETILSTFKPL